MASDIMLLMQLDGAQQMASSLAAQPHVGQQDNSLVGHSTRIL